MSALCCSSTRVRPRRITGSTCLNDAGFDEVDMSQIGDHQAGLFEIDQA